jgi:hypothetical protein
MFPASTITIAKNDRRLRIQDYFVTRDCICIFILYFLKTENPALLGCLNT